jgi:hypothetical protein
MLRLWLSMTTKIGQFELVRNKICRPLRKGAKENERTNISGDKAARLKFNLAPNRIIKAILADMKNGA